MKKIVIGIGLLMAAHCVVSASDYSKEIAEVKSGVRTEAKASWWGFDKVNATDCLQQAVQSGAKKVVIDNTGSDWLIDPILLSGNQELVVAADVTVRARPGGFQGKTDCLFRATSVENLIIRGESNAKLVMDRSAFQDKKLYTHSEWRHTIAINSCNNVQIRDLTIDGSGGDGIYLGVVRGRPGSGSTNVVIDNVTLRNHHRQGISIISAMNLLISNCLIENTGGTAPEAGIDFEPNMPSERLINCVVENCIIRNNQASAILIAVMMMNKDSQPISITVRNCKFEGNRESVRIVRQIGKGRGIPTGEILFENIEMITPRVASIRHDFAPGCPVRFKKCTFDQTKSSAAPQVLWVDMREADKIVNGEVSFDQCNILPGSAAKIVNASMNSPEQIGAVYSGSITLDGKPYDLSADWQKEKERVLTPEKK